MKKALVIGATGSMGFAIVNELSKRGIEVNAFARGEERLRRLFGKNPNVNLMAGDVFKIDRLIEAAKGADVIFHAMNVPYGEWEEKQPQLVGHILSAAERSGAKLVAVDNIYAYGKGDGTKVNERSLKAPHTKKGKIRLQLETMIKSAKTDALIAHFPDFYGPMAENTQLHYTLSAVLANKSAMFVGDQRTKREYIYTPDGAKALVELSLRESAYNQNWNIPGCGVISGEEFVQILRELTGYQKRVGTVTKTMLRMMGLFNKQMREMVEMMYLTEEPVILSGEKLEKELGAIPMTPYREGIRQTLQFMKADQNGIQ